MAMAMAMARISLGLRRKKRAESWLSALMRASSSSSLFSTQSLAVQDDLFRRYSSPVPTLVDRSAVLATPATIVQKLTPTDSSLLKAVPSSDGVLLSAGESRNSGFILCFRHVSASKRSLRWRTPHLLNTFARGYGSTNKKTFSKNKKQERKTSPQSRKQEQRTSSQSKKEELKVSDEDEDEDDNKDEDRLEDGADYEVLDEQQISDDDDHEVLDEQRISDNDDYFDNDEEEEEEGSEGMQGQLPAKKKFEIQSPKPKVVDEGPVLNEKITARTLRLVDEDGTGHRIVLRDEALFLAKKKQMDLVLVDPRRNPPVCKIFNFFREQYKKEQALKERKKTKGAAAKLNEVKELRYNAKTEPKDLKMKVQKAKQFLERGYKVKFVANFKGFVEEVVDRREEGKMIDQVISMLDDISVIEQGPRYESRLVWVMLKHMKFVKIKKKAKPAVQINTNTEEENVTTEALVGNEKQYLE